MECNQTANYILKQQQKIVCAMMIRKREADTYAKDDVKCMPCLIS